jgi:hypothetical protein
VVWKHEVPSSGELPWREFPRAYAFCKRIDEQLARQKATPPDGQRAPEEIRIPVAMAREIIALAELAEQQRAVGERLGAQCVAETIVGGQESVQGLKGGIAELFR